jgi:hypothetical protein
MQVQTHPLEPFFQNAIRSSYEGRLGLGPDISSYVSRMLCDFSEEDNLYRLHDAEGQPIQRLQDMVRASDPINGTARSFLRACVRRQSSRIPVQSLIAPPSLS